MYDLGWWIGFIGGLVLTISFIPQLKRMWDLRDEPFVELHPHWFTLNLIGSIMMFYYGFVISQPSLWILNGTGIVFLAIMLWIYWRAQRKWKV